MANTVNPVQQERLITLGPGGAAIPERLLLAHARGQVLFITGAGSSRPSRLPDFKGLVLEAYEQLDGPAHQVLLNLPTDPQANIANLTSGLTDKQRAEINRFRIGEYDVVLGMLERRIDSGSATSYSVRKKLAQILRKVRTRTGTYRSPKPSAVHRALVRLADRGVAITIATTNFDRLLEQAAKQTELSVPTHSLGGIPRPGLRADFSGILHIHGVLNLDSRQLSDIVVTDRDFGEFYLRRRIVPDFIYDAARLFHLVLVGYSASDAPMRYLLNAVAADGSRFADLKERFAFVGMPTPADPVALEDWRGRGITPIPYDSASNHSALSATLAQWANLSAVNGKQSAVDAIVRRIARQARTRVPEPDRDLVDHLFRRSSANEQLRLTRLASAAGAESQWLETFTSIAQETGRERF